LTSLFYVAAGGAIGSSLRYFASLIFKLLFPTYPLGTIFVNILGSFLIGILINNLENKIYSEHFLKYFLIIGLLGSFTTFSAFSIEVVELYNDKKIFVAILYILISVISCILASYSGYNISRIYS
tara:strand:+ start:65 stop:439 length:375 start_codon:yes stop_codon:yes gene_type:complete